MPAFARKRYVNVFNVTHGTDVLTTVQSVTVNDTVQRIQASGDNDKRATFQAKGMGDLTGTIEIQDQFQAEAIKNKAGATLTFDAEGEAGSAVKRVTILNVEFFGYAGGDRHNAVNGFTINWGAKSSDGVTNPMTVANPA